MPRRPSSSLDEPDTLPELHRGVPGVQWNREQPTPARPAAAIPADPDANESHALYLSLIFAVALALRLVVVTIGPLPDIDRAYTPQTPQQVLLAQHLADDKTFGVEMQAEGSLPAQIDELRRERGELKPVGETGLIPEIYAAPGYPAVLSVFRAAGLPLTWLLLLQCVIGAACVPLVYQLALGLLHRKMPATLASVVVALHPALLITPATLAGDTVVVALVLLGLAAVADAGQRDLRRAFGGGLALGAAALCAPILAWLAPLVAAWMVLSERRLRTVGLALVLLAGTALPVGGWVYRNLSHGLHADITARAAMDRLFGTVAAAEHPDRGPYAPQTADQLLTDFAAFIALPAQAEGDTITLLDRFGRERLNANHRGHTDAILHSGAKQLALDHSLAEAYARFGIPYTAGGGGYAAALLGEPVDDAAASETVTPRVIDAWVGLNALLVAGGALGLVMMLWHRRFAALTLVLTVAGYFVYVSAAGGGETLRLPLIGVQGLLLAAVLTPGPVREKKPKREKPEKLRKPEKLIKINDVPGDEPPAAEALTPVTKIEKRKAGSAATTVWAARDEDVPEPDAVASGKIRFLSPYKAAAASSPAPAYDHSIHPALRAPAEGGRPI